MSEARCMVVTWDEVDLARLSEGQVGVSRGPRFWYAGPSWVEEGEDMFKAAQARAMLMSRADAVVLVMRLQDGHELRDRWMNKGSLVSRTCYAVVEVES